MASLQILKGVNEGTVVPLAQAKFVLGRSPDCDVVIPVNSVSRYHATIFSQGGRYFIIDGDGEKERSRNGTFVNNQQVNGRTQLRNNDKVRICDFLACFIDPLATFEAEEEAEDVESSSTVEATLTQSSKELLDTQPAEKLRVMLEITANLSKTLDLDKLLPKIADSMFGLFRQADRCFIIQAEEGTSKLMPRVVKTRRPHDEANARYSKSIVKRCMETAQAFLSDDASRDERVQLSQSVMDFRIRSVMCVPLVQADGKAFGVIQVDTQDRSKKFTQDDLKLIWGVANQAAVALENAKLHQDAVAQERIRRDLELAHQVQLSFLPKTLPELPGYQFSAHYESALEVGGDYYGFIPLPGRKLAVAVGDVAGKGIPAALLMAKLSSDTRFSLLTEEVPAAAISKLNDLLCEFTGQMDRFVTFALAILDPAAHTVTMVNAGHLSPLLARRAPASFEDAVPASVAGLPLGIAEGFPFESCQVTLQPGDSLVLFTDGIPEAHDRANRQFGAKGVLAALQAAGATDPKTLVDKLVKAVQAHASGRDPHDDVTLVSFGRIA